MNSYIRFLSRNKFYSLIEAIGLAVSLAFVIIIGSYSWQQYSITLESPDRENIYCFGMPGYLGTTYAFIDEVKNRIPEAELATRYCIETVSPDVIIDNERITAKVTAVSKDFFTMFPYFRFVEGSSEGIQVPSNVIVSERFAKRFDLNVGQVLNMDYGNYLITGIIEDFQNTVLVYTDLIVNEHDIINESAWDMPYDRFGSTIPFIKFATGTDPQVIYDKVEAVCKEIYPEIFGQGLFEKLDMTRFDRLFFKDFGKPNNQLKRGDLATLKLLVVVGLLLLLSAVFNYINLSFALTWKRAKEMATRRLLGAQKTAIIWKYIAESLVFTAVCFGLGLILAYVFTPSMNTLLNDPGIPIKIQITQGYLIVYLLVIVVVGTLNGIIPAWFASRVQPMDVVKGIFKRNTNMVFNKAFIVIQNALAVFLVTMALVMEMQYRTSLNRPMHCRTKDYYYVNVYSAQSLDALGVALKDLPCVKRIGVAKGVPGNLPGGQYSHTRNGENIMYRHLRMDTTAFNMFGFEILKDYGAPIFNSVWFGEKAFAATGFDDSFYDISNTLGKKTSDCEQVAGVICDFPVTVNNIGEEEYLIVSIVKPEDIRWKGFVVETVGDHVEAAKAIQEVYEKWCDGFALFTYADGYIDDFYRDALKPMKNNMHLLEVFMFLAVLISLLGLIAMSTYYAGENARSIAVRKVFGDTVESETHRTVMKYMLLVLCGVVISVPIAVLATRRYLEQFICRMENYYWIFFVSVCLAFFMAYLSVLWQTLRIAKADPVKILRK